MVANLLCLKEIDKVFVLKAIEKILCSSLDGKDTVKVFEDTPDVLCVLCL